MEEGGKRLWKEERGKEVEEGSISGKDSSLGQSKVFLIKGNFQVDFQGDLKQGFWVVY